MSTNEKNSQRVATDKNKALEAVLLSHQTRIRVVGCGGGGNNTISRLMEAGVNSITTLAINTDAQDLLAAAADDKILIGQNITKGLGAGSNPQIGEDSARESQHEIEEALVGSDLVFVTCGLGGGTGTGSAPIVAEIAKKVGALTISIVTLPFTEEGVGRWENARVGLERLRQNSDTVIVIQNDRLLEVVPDMPLGMAFKVADEILVNAVKGITELITEKGLVNLDFADVRAIMQNGGTAMIGIGESEGAENAQAAVEIAMQNKLLEVDITGAKNALINITGGAQMPLKDAKMVMKIVAAKLDPSAKIIWGARIDPNLGKAIRVMLIVTNLQEHREAGVRPEPQETPVQLFQASLAPARKKRVLTRPSGLPKEEVDIKIAAAETTPATDFAAINDDETEVIVLPPVSRNGEDTEKRQPPAAPVREIILEKPRQPQRESVTVEKPVSQRVDAGERSGVRERVTPTVSFNETVPPEYSPKRKAAAANVEKPAPREEIKSESFAPPKTAAPTNERQNTERAVYNEREDYFTSSPITTGAEINGTTLPAVIDRHERFERTTPASAPAASRTGVPSKMFAEQCQIHLQIIRESLGRLYTDPTRQETLQRIKHATIAVNNLAKRFVFDVVATYAATIEEICERVLDGEINMSKKLINAFTEIPAIFDSLVNDDDDALIEARRHQERLQRLADSFIDGEVVNVDLNNRPSLPVPPARPAIPRPAPSPRAALKAAAQLEHQARPATEVMDYLDDFLVNRKKSTGLK